MSAEASGNGLDVTLREFVAGQKLFNRYTLIKTLGRGGMGVVWLARDDELERDVALKFLPELIIHDRAVLGDLKRETRRSLELTHKNIVRIYDFIHDQTSGCISMEYVDGDTLSNLRADKPRKVFEPDELTDWTSQLCDALDYAHNHARIVHRDLKPANLMVNQRGDLKVADFGIARSLSDSVSKLTMEHGKSGTLVYMSPQQLDGERGNHLDDVYSLGASIYELLTSKPPFYSGNVDRQIREKAPPSMTQRRKELEIEGEPIDPTWEDVVRQCLAKEPARRPQSVSEIAHQLEVPSPKTRRAARAAAEQSNKRIPLLTAIGIVLLVAVIGAWYFGFLQNFSKAHNVAKTQPIISEPKVSPKASVTPESAPAPTAIMGRVSVDTVPSGATITLGEMLQKGPAMFQQVRPGKYPMRITLDGYDTIEQQVEVKENQATDLGAITLQRSKPVTEPPTVPAGPKVTANAVYEGTIHVKNESSTNVPVAITIGSDLKSGTMTQSGRRGDVVVKLTGFGDGATLRAVTDEVISAPKGINWEPESFTLHFADDSKSATYECVADGKTYVADLSAQSAPVVKASPIYNGTIRAKGESAGSGTPLTLNLAADRRSGTMTQTSKSGDTVVRFNGIWDGDIIRAVTNEVISKPKNIQWKPESFTLRFADDGKTAFYECTADEKTYLANLAASTQPRTFFENAPYAAPTALATPTPRIPEKSWDRPHIYLQIADESQRKLAMKLRESLLRAGYTVVGIQNVSGNEDIPTQSSELRFFTPTDSAEAQRITKEIGSFFGNAGIFADLPEAMPYVSHARQYEIWFSSAFH
jgi:serine/threonine protein kinase